MYKLKNHNIGNFWYDNTFLRGRNMPEQAATGFPFFRDMQETPMMDVYGVVYMGPL